MKVTRRKTQVARLYLVGKFMNEYTVIYNVPGVIVSLK